MTTAPLIVVFAYNRPAHLERCLASLEACYGSKEFCVRIYCDGPRHDRDEDVCAQVRRVAGSFRMFHSTSVIAREGNLGLSRNVIEGVSESLRDRKRVIIVEDDLVLSPQFLEFMSHGLELYENDEQVASIHGYVYPVDASLPDSFFLRGADCWGWGTWRRAWERFQPDGSLLLEGLRARGLDRRFDLEGAMDYTKMLRDQISGRNDSWAIRWHASAFLAGMLTLYPGTSLVRNMGFDGSGTHAGRNGGDWNSSWKELPMLTRVDVEECCEARDLIADWLRRRRNPWRRFARGFWGRVRGRFSTFAGEA